MDEGGGGNVLVNRTQFMNRTQFVNRTQVVNGTEQTKPEGFLQELLNR